MQGKRGNRGNRGDREGKQAFIARFTSYAVLLITLLYPLYIYAASAVDIVIKQRVILAQKRGIVTLPFSVVNRSSKTLHFIEDIDLPEGWRILANTGSFTLGAGETSLRLVHVLASSDVPAGKYTIPYRIISRDNSAIRAEKNISVVIKTTSKLSVAVIEKPVLVLAGEEYAVKVRVENKGNVAVSLGVNIKDSSAYLTSFTPHHLKLKPSQKAIISIHSKIPKSIKKSSHHQLKLSLKGKSIAVDKVIKTQIVSFQPEGTGLYHTIPTKVTMTYTSDRNNNGDNDTANKGKNGVLQTELVAIGNLDEEGKHHLNLLYRDTKTNTLSSLGSDSEKRLSYNNNFFTVHLGDRSYSLAGITDDGLYGKGVEVGYHPPDQKWNIRTFIAEYDQDQQDNAEEEVIKKAKFSGFEVGYRFDHNFELAINALSKEENDNSQSKETITGIDMRWDKYASAEATLSLAKDKDGSAFRLQQYGSLGDFNYDLEIQKADADFDGRIKDIKSESFTGIYSFNDNKNYIRANVYHAQHNLKKDTNKRIPEEKNFSLGGGHYFNNLRQDSLYTELFTRETQDQRKLSDYNQIEQGIKIDYQKNISQQLRLNTIFEHAIKKDKIKNRKSTKNRGSLTLAYTPSEKYNFGFNIDSTKNSSTYDAEDSLSYGVNAAIRFDSKQVLSGYWRHTKVNDSLQLNYNHTFHNGISLGASVSTDTLKTKQAEQNKQNNLEYQLRLSVPFDTPLYKYKNIGSLQGKVYNKALKQPVSNAIVGVAGQYAVTDKQGNYKFKAIREGRYDLTTNLTKTQLNNYLVENKQQRKARLIANKISMHNINLVAGTGVSGQVLAYSVSNGSVMQANDNGMKPSGGIESLLVTLVSTNNSEIVHKALTSEGGFFSFNGIKAGPWMIQVTDPRKVIKDLRVEQPQRIIYLKIGKDKDIVFKAIPLIKKIKRIGPSSGFNVIGE